jgi:hypothetical protein
MIHFQGPKPFFSIHILLVQIKTVIVITSPLPINKTVKPIGFNAIIAASVMLSTNSPRDCHAPRPNTQSRGEQIASQDN